MKVKFFFGRIMYFLRSRFLLIKNRGFLHLPFNARLDRNTEIKCDQGSVTVGKQFSTKRNVYIAAVEGGTVQMGDDVFINRNTIIIAKEKVQIGNHCAFGPNVCIYDHDHRFGYEGIEAGYKSAPIVIENNCWIGAGVIILRGTHIGEGCIIGAGCVITSDIPEHSIVTSNANLKYKTVEKSCGNKAAISEHYSG